jgi:hypothetical protein
MPPNSLLKSFEQKLILHLKNVFLSGGFSENEYLFKEVKRYTDSTGHIQLQRADDWFVDSLPKINSHSNFHYLAGAV